MFDLKASIYTILYWMFFWYFIYSMFSPNERMWEEGRDRLEVNLGMCVCVCFLQGAWDSLCIAVFPVCACCFTFWPCTLSLTQQQQAAMHIPHSAWLLIYQLTQPFLLLFSVFLSPPFPCFLAFLHYLYFSIYIISFPRPPLFVQIYLFLENETKREEEEEVWVCITLNVYSYNHPLQFCQFTKDVVHIPNLIAPLRTDFENDNYCFFCSTLTRCISREGGMQEESRLAACQV